jgi:predicted Zn-dependent protease
MSPAERAALESQIERHLKRGEMGDAWAKAQQLADAFPDDVALAGRLVELEAGLDPAERRRVSFRQESTGGHKSPMSRAEELASSGKFADAISIYRDLLASRPDWELVKERLSELYQLAQVAAPNRVANHEGLLEHLLDRIATRRRH